MKRILSILMVWSFFVLSYAQKEAANSVVYNGNSIELQENAKSYQTLKSAGGVNYVIMQFFELPSKEDRQSLLEKGIKLNEYLGSNAYLVELSTSSLKSASSDVRSVVSLNEVVKISAELQKGEIPKCAMKPNHSVELVVSFFRSAGDEKITADLEAIGASEIRISPFFERLTCILPTAQVEKLNGINWLKYAAPVAPEFETFDMQATRQMGASVINGSAGADKSLTGKGINIGVWDGDVEHHYDFQGRVTQREYEYHETSHGIHVSGIMAGAGIIDPTTKGVATEATMETWNFNMGSNKMSNGEEMYLSARDYGIVITQNSYGIPHNGGFSWYYLDNDVNLDKVAYDFPNLLHVFAAGNSRGTYTYETVSHAAKNIVAVGAIDMYNRMTDFSSWGPVHDGRLVPHVVANGVDAISCSYYNDYTDMTGTSQATPVVSGIAAQLYELYKSQNGGKNPKSSLIKAALCNTAHDLGNKGPDFSFGFGSVVASDAAALIEKEQYIIDQIANEEEQKVTVYVPAGVNQVKFMLAWTDPEASQYTKRALINDLDLSVDFKGAKYLPYILNPEAPIELATRGEDHLNNIEQVVIETPTPGYYDVYISGTAIAVPDQEYALVYAFNQDNINMLSPIGGEVFAPGGRTMVYWSAPDTNTTPFTIQLSKDGGQSYTTIGKVEADQRAYAWELGSDVFGNAKIRVIAGKYFDQSNEAFSVIDRPVIEGVDPEMPVSSISWDAVDGADAYKVYKLQDGEAVLVEQITETSYTLHSRVLDEDNWYAVAAVNTVNGIESVRSKAIKLRPITNVSSFPFEEDFEGEEVDNITLIQPKEGQLAIGYDVDRESKFLKFEGTVSGATYSYIGSVDEVWGYNPTHISTAKFTLENTTGLSSLILAFDLKQTYCIDVNDNILKVFINGEQVTDVLGSDVFQPETPSYDRSRRRYFDLSKFVGIDIEVEFKGMCHYPMGAIPGASQGDVIDIDNIKLYEKPAEDMAVLDVEFPWSGLNLGEEVINIKVANLGDSPISDVDVAFTLYKDGTEAETIQEKITSTIGSMGVFSYSFSAPADLTAEDVKYHVITKVFGTVDADESNNEYKSYSSYNYGNIVPMAYNGTSGTKEVPAEGLVFTDGGTRVFNYPDKTRSSYTFTPSEMGKKVKISFSELSLEKDYDYLYLFAGGEASGKPMAVLNGALADLEQTEFISTALYGQLTVLFVSDEAVNETGWIANVTLADNPNAIDIGVAEITNPVAGGDNSSSELVGVTISNYGANEVASYKVAYTVNGGEPTEVEFTTPLRSGGSKFVTFYKQEDFSVFGKEYVVEAYVILDGDEVSYNDRASVTIKSDYVGAIGFGGGLYISNVTLGDINYSSGDNMYENHADMETTMEYGKSYMLYVTKNDVIGSGKYWIDWNLDGLFSEDEAFLFSQVDGTLAQGVVTPPNNVMPGKKRLRIRVATFGEMNPIGGHVSGEVEDYTISLTGTPPAVDVAIVGLNIDKVVNEGSNSIGVEVINGSTTAQSFPVNIQIGSVYSGVEQVSNLAAGESKLVTFDDVMLAKGEYEINVEAELAADELQDNNIYSMQIEAKSITPVYAYSIIGSGGVSSGSFKFNLENAKQANQVVEMSGFYPYCGTIAGDRWLVQSRGGTLSSIDMETGEVTAVGASGVSIRDMAYDPVEDVIYGRLMKSDIHPVPNVYRIDVNTGSATFVGNISVPAIETIACDITGKMYGLDNKGMLYHVNKTTWEATEIGNVGIITGTSPHPIMFFDHNNGMLYMAACNVKPNSDDYEIRRINTSTGESTLVEVNNDFRRSTCYAVVYSEAVAKSLARVTAFNVTGSVMQADIDEVNKVISVPVAVGTDVSNVSISFALSPGASAQFAGGSVANGEVLDLVANSTFTVVSMDGLVTENYTIVVQDPINTEALLLSYSIEEETSDLDGFVVSATVAPQAPFNSLQVAFELSARAKAYVGDEMLSSGVSKLDHSKPFMLKVVAEDGVTVNYYMIEVTRNANNEAEITYFLIEAALNSQLIEDLMGVINGSAITVNDVPFGVTNLIPSFAVSAGAEVSVDSKKQHSGIDDVDFMGDVSYMVMSEDGSANKEYVVTINNLTTDVDKSEDVSQAFRVYPNPASDVLYMSNQEAGMVKLYNAVGTLVFSQEVYQNNAILHLEEVPVGLYILKFKGETTKAVTKVKVIH